MAPHWAIAAGWAFLGLGFASALVILVDELVLGYRQHMWMQVGMVLGFCTAYPVNRFLLSVGWKKKMVHRAHLAKRIERLRERSPAPRAATAGR